MNNFFESINKNAILKYLSYRSGEIPGEIMEEIDRALAIVEKVSRPKYVYRVIGKDDPILKDILMGQDINDMVKDSFKIILLAVTLGQEIEMEVRRLSFTDLSLSVVTDAAASAAVEALADNVAETLQKDFEGFYFTDMFSPGYGDLPIGIQDKFLTLINAKKELGLTTTREGIMVPRKSISAIMGVSKNKQTHRHRGCESCRLFMDCEFRKRGEDCGYQK